MAPTDEDMLAPAPDNDSGAPRMVRRCVLGVVAALLAGAGYLIAIRGEALLVDLATLGSRVWCF